MKLQEPDQVAKLDWRLNAVTWTTAPAVIPGIAGTIESGSGITQAGVVKHGREGFAISIPNATALFLDLSRSSHDSALHSLAKAIAEGTPGASGHLPDERVFACIQSTMASVVFACTALEAFVNEMVPDDFVYTVVEDRVTRQYNKQQIERGLPLDKKVGEVLPVALRLKSPKGGKLWSDYQKLRELRDRVVHMKTADRFFQGDASGSIWQSLLTSPLPPTYAPAKAMMRHFFSSAHDWPRWLSKCPF